MKIYDGKHTNKQPPKPRRLPIQNDGYLIGVSTGDEMNTLIEHTWECPDCKTMNTDIYGLTAEPMCSNCSNTYSWDDIGFNEIAKAFEVAE